MNGNNEYTLPYILPWRFVFVWCRIPGSPIVYFLWSNSQQRPITSTQLCSPMMSRSMHNISSTTLTSHYYFQWSLCFLMRYALISYEVCIDTSAEI